MKIAYFCKAGEKRSPILAICSQALAPQHTFISSPMDDWKIERNESNREKRLVRLEGFRDGIYANYVKRLREGGGNIHPRIGVLLLDRGFSLASSHRSLPFSEVKDADLALVVDPLMINPLRMNGFRGDIQSVGNFLGVGGVFQDSNYGLFGGLSLTYQLAKDGELVDRGIDFSRRITERLRDYSPRV